MFSSALTPNGLRAWRDAGKTIDPHEIVSEHCRVHIDKFVDIDLDDPLMRARWQKGRFDDGSYLILPRDDYWEGEKNILMTVGATDLWNGFVTSGLSNPYQYGNGTTTLYGMIGVGDSSTAASAGQTDLQAAASSGIQTSGFTSVSNATPIVIVNGSGAWSSSPYGTNASAPATVGNVIVISGITTETAANGTFELTATTNTTTITLLNSAGNGTAGSLASGVAKALNRYWQAINGAPTVSTNQVQFVAVFGSTHANHLWNEMATSNGYTNTGNSQAAPPANHVGNRFVSSMGTKGSGSSWTATETISLS